MGVEEHPVLHKYPGVLSDGYSALNRRGLMLAKAKIINSQELAKMEIVIFFKETVQIYCIKESPKLELLTITCNLIYVYL